MSQGVEQQKVKKIYVSAHYDVVQYPEAPTVEDVQKLLYIHNQKMQYIKKDFEIKKFITQPSAKEVQESYNYLREKINL